jgi:hypothetical protein
MGADGGFSFSMGPGGNQLCCGKPVGCTMTHPECSFLRHRWKLANISGLRERLEAEKEEGT